MTTLYQWNKYNNNRVSHTSTSSKTGTHSDYASETYDSQGYPMYGWIPVDGASDYYYSDSSGYSGYIPYTGCTRISDVVNSDGTQTTTWQRHWSGTVYSSYTYYTDAEGSLATILFEPIDAHTDGVKNADGYWYERISAIPDPSTIIFPKGGETLVNQQTLYWSPATDADTDQTLLQYEVQLSTDNGVTWKDLVALTQANVTNLTHDFSTESETTTGLVRVRGYDGTNYGQWYQSPSTFTIVHRVKVGEIHTSGLTIPIYDPNTGLDNKNQLRITDKNNNVASFELVDVTDGKASPFRVKTTEGVKAIANA